MNKDYYIVLGIERSASKDDIKMAFHKLARKYHPDNKTTGDEGKFKEINEAYQTLSDERKRGEYDTYGRVFSEGGGQSNTGFEGFYQDFQGFGGGAGSFDFGDIFSEFFGGGGTRVRRGSDISVNIEIPFVEAIFGSERKILLTKTSACDSCHGSGALSESGFETCKTCNGKGKVHETRNSFLGSVTSVRECSQCRGQGKIPKAKCRTCHGLGILKRQEEIAIRIPAGIENGEVIRLSQMGEALPHGGVAGDLYIKIGVLPHSIFQREGNNLVMNLDIKLSHALLGGEYPLTLLDNTVLQLKIPAGTSMGEVLRLKGKGIPLEKGRTGDLLVRLKIKLPKHLSAKAKKLFEELRKEGI